MPGSKSALSFGRTAKHAVYHRHGLGTGDIVIRTECVVCVTCDPAQRAALSILFSAQWPEISEKLVPPFICLLSKLAQITENSARVIGASGSKDPALLPFTTPSFSIVETAVLNHCPLCTSSKVLLVVTFLSRMSDFSNRKKMVATSARLILALGRIVPSA